MATIFDNLDFGSPRDRGRYFKLMRRTFTAEGDSIPAGYEFFATGPTLDGWTPVTYNGKEVHIKRILLVGVGGG